VRELAPLFIPVRFVSSFARSFHPAELPPMLRRTYGRELVSWAFLPLMLGAIEGGAIAVVIKKAFDGQPGVDPEWLDLATAWALAAPNIANLTSFIWAALARGRPKVPFISWLQIVACTLVAAIALFPRDAFGLVAVCIVLGLARTAWTGVITVRAAVWRNNYPNANRATIAGKLATIQSIFLAAAGFVASVEGDRLVLVSSATSAGSFAAVVGVTAADDRNTVPPAAGSTVALVPAATAPRAWTSPLRSPATTTAPARTGATMTPRSPTSTSPETSSSPSRRPSIVRSPAPLSLPRTLSPGAR
jgi:hypothetical protein